MDILVETNLPTYEKCGEVMTLYNTDQHRIYALNCIFCENRFSTLPDFIKHIEELHITTTKEEKNLLESKSKCIDATSIEPKEEYVDVDFIESVISLDPLISTELKTSSDKKDCEDGHKSQQENAFKMESEDEVDDDDGDYECANSSEDSEGSESEDDKKTTNRFLDGELDANKDVTLALIEGLKDLPVLWQKSSSKYGNRKSREEALQSLAKDLNKKFGKRMKWTGIDERIKKLSKRFRSEVIKEKNANLKGEAFTPTWYFSKLDFLRNIVKLKERKLQNVDKSVKIAEIPFKDEQHIQFIKIYESFPCLWNIEDVGFKSKTQRENAIKEMLKTVEEKMQMQLAEDELQRKIQRIRAACTKEKHEVLNCERLGTTHAPTYKYFSSIAFLMEHVCPFKCPHCSKTFKGREIFRVHKAEHDGSSPFTCSICKKSYSSPGNLAIHLRRHNRDYTYECKPCSRKFATTDEYNIHMRQHTGEKPYFCEVCGKSFATCSLFGRHKRRHEKRPSHFCEICNRGFYEQIRYKEHMNIHNDVRDRICDVCGKGFTHLKYLKQHVLIHTGRRDYVCTICGKDFAQSAGLYWHMKTHGAKVCDKTQKEGKGPRKETLKIKKEKIN